MAGKAGKMKVLEEQRDALLSEMEALRNKIAGLEMAMSLISSDASPTTPREGRAGRGSVKTAVLDLLRQSGTTGLTAPGAVEIAQARGIKLDLGSVRSLLSRFKREELAVFDGERYKLKQFAHATERPQPPQFVAVK